MAARCRSSKCTVERNGFKRELDTWRHKLINCVGFESILEGIYGPLLLRDLNIFDDCEPEELEDWAVKASCSFCSLLINDHVPVAASPSDDTPSQAPSLSDSSLSAHRFLHAVFHKKELASSGDPNVPLVAQELMKRMVRQFAMEYASKTRLTTTTGSQRSDLDSPLDLTVTRNQEEEPTPADSVLDLSKRNSASSESPLSPSLILTVVFGPPPTRRQQQRWGAAGAYQTEEHHAQRSSELSEGLLSKALRDVRSGRLQENRAALLYGIPLEILRSELGEDVTSQDVAAAHGEEVRLVLQRVAAWAELGAREENGEMLFLPSSSSCLTRHGLQRVLSRSLPPQLREELHLRIPQVRSRSRPAPPLPEPCSLAEHLHYHPPPHHGTTTTNIAATSSSLLRLHRSLLPSLDLPDLSPHHRCSSLDDPEEGAEHSGENKQSRKKRGRYRQYDHDLLEEAITMVMGGRMSISKAQVVYGIPHSTLEYKVKERNGTLKIPPKRRPLHSGHCVSMQTRL
uniref:HTH psq-type domain-containing protein n=1 Tax=Oncorhynchus kisutch TaxID=8019 RepID=A0A8C7IVC2_ONCKI